MDPPAYQDVPASAIPIVEVASGVRAKIIAGECGGVKAVVNTLVPVQYVDFMLEPSASFSHPVPSHMDTCLCYIYEGGGTFSPQHTATEEGQMHVMGTTLPLPVWPSHAHTCP
jgi:redox-sensitive bicupin YhaK (pirin superfamily)